MRQKKFLLQENEIPRQWYNIQADMPNKPLPLLNPATHEPLTPNDLAHIFSAECSRQELDQKHSFIDIPDEVFDKDTFYRATPLVRAYALEKALDTPAHIYFKNESVNPLGSHKVNSAIPQCYYCKQEGDTNVTTETGAGQWGAALSYAAKLYGLEAAVYQVKITMQQKPYRSIIMRTFGATVEGSPSMSTRAGKNIITADPNHPGSLGTAISEAIELATTTPHCKYTLGSVLNHVALHQTIIGLEAQKALKKYDIKPDIIIGCAGGGSNLGGLISPFVGEMLRGENDYKIIAVEPASCPSFTRGKFAYDFCDTGMICPLAKMYTLGSQFLPSANHAGGLRFHGMSPILSQLYHDGLFEARSVEQTEVFAAAEQFARVEGTLPAPESSHAIRVAIDEALKCKETGEEKTILFGLTGTGYFDLYAYEQFNNKTMTDVIPSDETIAMALAKLPKVDL